MVDPRARIADVRKFISAASLHGKVRICGPHDPLTDTFSSQANEVRRSVCILAAEQAGNQGGF